VLPDENSLFTICQQFAFRGRKTTVMRAGFRRAAACLKNLIFRNSSRPLDTSKHHEFIRIIIDLKTPFFCKVMLPCSGQEITRKLLPVYG
jgi:hypothetical protein